MILLTYKKDYKTMIYFIRITCQLEDELLELLKPYIHSNNTEKCRQIQNLLNRIMKAERV